MQEKNFFRSKMATAKYIAVAALAVSVLIVVFMVLFYLALGRGTLRRSGNPSGGAATMASSEEPQAAVGTYKVRDKPLLTDFTKWNSSCDWNLRVVNNRNFLPNYFKPQLEECAGKEVDFRIVDSLEEMFAAASTDGVNLWIVSGYRSQERQQRLFEEAICDHMSDERSQEQAEYLAASVVARPGASEHHTGLAVDLCSVEETFAATPEYKWLHENAWRHGFVERYTKVKEPITGIIWEPWHFRFVGEQHARAMHEADQCLEEYISYNLI